MPPGTTNVFDVSRNGEQFREWQRGNRVTETEHLNDVPKKLNRGKRGVGPGSQVLPEGRGGAVGAAGPSTTIWKTDVHWVLDTANILDGLQAFRHNVFENIADPMPWVVMKPWPLRRTPFQRVGDSQYDFTWYMYDGHVRRQATSAISELSEWQKILPKWNHQDIFTAKRVSLSHETDKVFRRTRVNIVVTAYSHPSFTNILIYAGSGSGDEIPSLLQYVVLTVQADGKPAVEGQINTWNEGGNPTARIQPGHGIEYDPQNPTAVTPVDIEWSWRWEADGDGRAWTREHNAT